MAVANYAKLLPSAATRNAPARMEGFWREAFAPLRELASVRDVRVLGSIAAVEVAVDGGYLATVGRRVRDLCLERGVLLRPLGNVVYAMPPLLTSDDSLQRIADAINFAVRSL